MIKSKQISIAFCLSGCIILSGCAASKNAGDNAAIEVNKIWDQGPHNAFTDLVRFNNAFYCTFREGTTHVKGWDGKARVLKSTDGKTWTSVALLKMDNRDVRDPKISITPDQRLMVLMDVEANDNGKVISRNKYSTNSVCLRRILLMEISPENTFVFCLLISISIMVSASMGFPGTYRHGPSAAEPL